MAQREAHEPAADPSRRFVVVAHRAVARPGNLNDLASSSGRWDLLARCINAALLVSHAMRRDADLYLVLRAPPDGPKTLRLSGATLGGLNPDERSAAALAFKALEKPLPPNGEEIESSWGLFVSRRDLPRLVDDLRARGPLYVLDERGEPAEAQRDRLASGGTFVLSDHQDFTPEERDLLRSAATGTLSLGPLWLHTDHCLAVLNNVLDRARVTG